jgi:hypothetical protein
MFLNAADLRAVYHEMPLAQAEAKPAWLVHLPARAGAVHPPGKRRCAMAVVGQGRYQIGGGHTPHRWYGVLWLLLAATSFALLVPDAFEFITNTIAPIAPVYAAATLGLLGLAALVLAIQCFGYPADEPVLYVVSDEGIEISGRELVRWSEISSIERRGDAYMFVGHLVTTDPIMIRPSDHRRRQADFHMFLLSHAPAHLITGL